MKLCRQHAQKKQSSSKKQPAFKDTIKSILKKTSKMFQKQQNSQNDEHESNGQQAKNDQAPSELHHVKKLSVNDANRRASDNVASHADENVMFKKTKHSWTKSMSSSSNVHGETQIAFFCSNDKYFNSCDDNEMIQMIQSKYPNFMRYGTDDIEIKKTLMLLFQDKSFIDEFMQFYNISIQDFFKFIFRNEMSVFKGPYISKVSKVLRDAGYEL